MNNSHAHPGHGGSLHYSARMRSRSKQPIYTSDKRAKFTQRESKKWIRFITVLGYIVFVSLPAISLSIYYVYIWDPGYIKKFPNEASVNRSLVFTKPSTQRLTREINDPITEALIMSDKLSTDPDSIFKSIHATENPAQGTQASPSCVCEPSSSPLLPSMAPDLGIILQKTSTITPPTSGEVFYTDSSSSESSSSSEMKSSSVET